MSPAIARVESFLPGSRFGLRLTHSAGPHGPERARSCFLIAVMQAGGAGSVWRGRDASG